MNIFKKTISQNRKSILIWSAVCLVLAVLFMAFFPSMKVSQMQQLVNTKMDAMPEALLQMFHMAQMPDFTKLDEYFAYVMQFLAMAMYIYAGILGVSALADEEYSGTIEYLYAMPVTRTRIYYQKFSAAVASFVIFAAVVTATFGITCVLMKPEDSTVSETLLPILSICLMVFISGVVYLAIGFFIASLLKKTGATTVVSLGVFFLTYFLGIMANMMKQLDFLRYLSPFEYAQPNKILQNGLCGTDILILLAAALLCVAAGQFVYRKKNYVL